MLTICRNFNKGGLVMTFGDICLVVSVIAVVLAAVNGRSANSVLAVPMFFIFLITLIAGVFSLLFDSVTIGVVVIVLMVLWLCSTFLP